MGVKMSHQEQLWKIGFVKRPGPAFTLSLQNHGFECVLYRTTVGRP